MKAYAMAVQGGAYLLPDGNMAVEGAFAEHLLELRSTLADDFSEIMLLAPQMSEARYRQEQRNLTVVPIQSGIVFRKMWAEGTVLPRVALGQIINTAKAINAALNDAEVLHCDLSTDFRSPLTLMISEIARRKRIPTMLTVDIDYRQNRARHRGVRALMNAVQSTYKTSQIKRSVRRRDLVLLKSEEMARDFGGGLPNVRAFYDAAHSAKDLANQADISIRKESVRSSEPLKACYFGRLVDYKGVDLMIDAVARSKEVGGKVHLQIIGDGPAKVALMAQADRARVIDRVTFEDAVPYGDPLFAKLSGAHVMLAAPRLEDTPRAAFDGFARGLPLIAFDTSYYRALASGSGAVTLAKWGDVSAFAKCITAADRNRGELATMMDRAVKFAEENTQSRWVQRRCDWLKMHLTQQRRESASD